MYGLTDTLTDARPCLRLRERHEVCGGLRAGRAHPPETTLQVQRAMGGVNRCKAIAVSSATNGLAPEATGTGT